MKPPDYTAKAEEFCAQDSRVPGWVRHQVRCELEEAWKAGVQAGLNNARVRIDRAFLDEPLVFLPEVAEPHDMHRQSTFRPSHLPDSPTIFVVCAPGNRGQFDTYVNTGDVIVGDRIAEYRLVRAWTVTEPLTEDIHPSDE